MRTEIDVTLADPDADVEEFRRMAQGGPGRLGAGQRARRRAAGAGPQRGPVRRRLVRKAPPTSPPGVGARCPRWARRSTRINLDVTPNSTRPRSSATRPAGAAGRQPGRERRALQPPPRPDLGTHRRRRRALLAGRGQHRLRGRSGRRAGAVRTVPPRRPGAHRRAWLGLGLSIVRAVCEAHGGSVSAVASTTAASR